MEMKIYKDGYLHIKRAGEWFKVFCPYAPGEDKCGHWCALFGEPVTDRYVNEDGHNESETYVDLCRKSLYGTIIDEREGSVLKERGSITNKLFGESHIVDEREKE